MSIPTLLPTNLADHILGELGDDAQTIWTQAEIVNHIKKVLFDFTMRTLVSWKRLPLPDVAGQATYAIPPSFNFHQLDRAEYDFWVTNPTPPRVSMAGNGRFETSGNRPLAIMMQGDGIDTLRKIGVPTESDSTKFIIEFFATGALVADQIDLPTRYLFYIAAGVKSRAYHRDGDGQSRALAKYWAMRYEDGIEMVSRRRERLNRRRISNIGNDGKLPEGNKRRDPGTLPAYFPKVE